jgi:hypothetical protein
MIWFSWSVVLFVVLAALVIIFRDYLAHLYAKKFHCPINKHEWRVPVEYRVPKAQGGKGGEIPSERECAHCSRQTLVTIPDIEGIEPTAVFLRLTGAAPGTYPAYEAPAWVPTRWGTVEGYE